MKVMFTLWNKLFLLVILLLINLCSFLTFQELESLRRKDNCFLLILISVVKFNRFCYRSFSRVPSLPLWGTFYHASLCLHFCLGEEAKLPWFWAWDRASVSTSEWVILQLHTPETWGLAPSLLWGGAVWCLSNPGFSGRCFSGVLWPTLLQSFAHISFLLSIQVCVYEDNTHHALLHKGMSI